MGYYATFEGSFTVKKGMEEAFIKFLKNATSSRFLSESNDIEDLFNMYLIEGADTCKVVDTDGKEIYEFSGSDDHYHDEDFEVLAPYVNGEWSGEGENGCRWTSYWRNGKVEMTYPIEITPLPGESDVEAVKRWLKEQEKEGRE